MRHTMSNELKDFLADWYDWATTKNGEGLSAAGFEYLKAQGLCGASCKKRSYELTVELCNILDVEFGEELFPFGGIELYTEHRIAKLQHQNPIRLEWVREQLGLTE